MRDITNVTEECRGRITKKGVEDGMQVVVGMGGFGEQSVLSSGHDEDGNDVEEVSLFSLLPSSFYLLLNHPNHE